VPVDDCAEDMKGETVEEELPPKRLPPVLKVPKGEDMLLLPVELLLVVTPIPKGDCAVAGGAVEEELPPKRLPPILNVPKGEATLLAPMELPPAPDDDVVARPKGDAVADALPKGDVTVELKGDVVPEELLLKRLAPAVLPEEFVFASDPAPKGDSPEKGDAVEEELPPKRLPPVLNMPKGEDALPPPVELPDAPKGDVTVELKGDAVDELLPPKRLTPGAPNGDVLLPPPEGVAELSSGLGSTPYFLQIFQYMFFSSFLYFSISLSTSLTLSGLCCW
jgi:hypothetical protein